VIEAPILLLAAGVVAAIAVRRADRVVVLARIGGVDGRRDGRSRRQIPDVEWRGWPLVGAAAGWLLGGVVTAGLAAVAAALSARTLLRRRASRLRAAIDQQLADMVRSLAAGMRAGLSIPQAVAYAAREGEPPLRDALQLIVDEVRLGDGLEQALDRWASEVGTDDARLVVGVLGLHRRTGGDLPRVLDQVAITLRDRTSAALEVRALTAQARLSGAILGLLPVGFFGFLWLTSRTQIEGAFRSPVGIAALLIGLVLEVLAFLWIRKLLEVT
jgi:tight adherence protein B